MKKVLLAAAAVMALPAIAEAQDVQTPGFYIGVEGGLNWMFNTTILGAVNVTPQTGWAAGGMIGYDFVGPRVELEGVYRQNQRTSAVLGDRAINNQVGQLGIMANLLYDFMPGSAITPYIGAGAGVGFVDSNASLGSTVFAYQGIIGLGWNVDPNFRVQPRRPLLRHDEPDGRTAQTGRNNNFSVMLGLQLKFGVGSAAAAAAAAGGDAAVVHGVLRLGPLEPVAAGADHDPAGGRRLQDQGQRPHHGDRPHRHVGPGSLQHGAVAASCQRGQGRPGARRRAGAGDHGDRHGREAACWCQTGDGVREPQNRRVEIVIQ